MSPVSRRVGAAIAIALAVAAVIAVVNRRALVLPSSDAPDAASDAGRTIGKPDAMVLLDLWSDFQCPSCRQFEARIEPNIVREYVDTGRARLTFHDMAFLGPESINAAVAARCADRQGKFQAYKRLLFANQAAPESGGFDWSRLTELAGSLQLDLPQFTMCANDRSVAAAVSAETQQAYARGVKQTPTLTVSGVPVASVNDWQRVSAAIEAAMASAGAPRR